MVRRVERLRGGGPLDWEGWSLRAQETHADGCRVEQENQWIDECLGDLTDQQVDNLGIACPPDPSYKGGLSPAASCLELVAAASFLETHLAPGTHEQGRMTYFKSWWERVVRATD